MLNPDLEGFLQEWTSQWSTLGETPSPRARREHFEIVAKNMRLPTPENVATDNEHWIETEAGAVRVRVFRHQSAGAQPCLIYMHGGAWMQGSPETHWDITARLAAWSEQTVISVDYALAPEHPFPAAVTQCEAVTRWAVDNAIMLDIDPARVSVGGDSAGANLAASIALTLRDSRIELIGQLLIYPPVDFEMERLSYLTNANAPLLNVAGMPAVNAAYCPNPDDLRDPRAAPIFAERHDGLPPAYVAVAENDPLRDDGIDYAEKLKQSGVPAELDLGEGLIHGYLRAMHFCPASEQSLRKMANWLSTLSMK